MAAGLAPTAAAPADTLLGARGGRGVARAARARGRRRWPRPAARPATRRCRASACAPCPPAAVAGATRASSTPAPAPSATARGGDADTERARALDPPPAGFRDPERLRRPVALPRLQRPHLRRCRHGHAVLRQPLPRRPLGPGLLRLPPRPRGRGRARAGRGAPGRHGHALRPRDDGGAAARGRCRTRAAAVAWVRREARLPRAPRRRGDRPHAAAWCARPSPRRPPAAPAEADRLVLDAYLQGFEPLEPRLRARDAAATLEVEAAFRDLRAAIRRGDAGRVRRRGRRSSWTTWPAWPERAGAPVVPFIAAFLIYFREGVEAALLVGALLAGRAPPGPARRRAVRPRGLAGRPARGRRSRGGSPRARDRDRQRPARAGGGGGRPARRRRCCSRSASG